VNATWTGLCVGCHREGLEVAPSADHYQRVLCAACAARPHRVSAADVDPAALSNGTRPVAATVAPLRTRRVDLARVRPTRWAWERRVPFGYLALLLGAEGIGKGTALAWLTARLTRGELPGDLHGTPVRVLWIGDEDSFDAVVYPRLHAAGADPDGVETLADGEALHDLAASAAALAATVKHGRFGVLIFDQLLDHLGALDDWRAKQVRDALRPLRRVAREHDVAVLAALHPNKGQRASFRDLLSGSHQFNALSRSSLLLAAHPDDRERRVLVRGKGNLCAAPRSFEFAVHGRDVEINQHTFSVPLVSDHGEGDLSVEELLAPVRESPVLDNLVDAIDAVGTGDDQRRSDLARAVGREADDRQVGRALEELQADGRWEKTGRGKWRKIGIGVSKATPIANTSDGLDVGAER